MRKFLEPKFWSLGTNLGFLGAVSQQDMIIGFSQLQFLVILNPYDYSVLVALQTHAKNPKPAGAWCDMSMTTFHFVKTFPDLKGVLRGEGETTPK